MKESYEYPNPIYSIQVMLMGKKKIKEKVILYFKVACVVDIKLFSYGLILL